MEVMVPLSDFHFSGVSVPSSPKQRFAGAPDPFDFYCNYNSAPTSPTRAAAIFSHFNSLASPSAGVPFDWEEKPGTPKSPGSPAAAADAADDEEFNFELGFRGRLLAPQPPPELAAADELFEQGKIRPLKPPPRLQYPAADDKSRSASSPRSPKSWGLWSPRRRGSSDGKDIDPFTAAMVETTRDRGRRERAPRSSATAAISSSRGRKGSRSLSPLRGGGGAEAGILNQASDSFSYTSVASAGGEALKGSGNKKWSLKDLLLFRSASEGRAICGRSKDSLRKYYTPVSSSSSADSKASSFRRMEGGKEYSTSTRGTGAGVAAQSHELHYTANRPEAVELKRKMALPYRHSFFSFLGFNSAMNSVARGCGGY